MKWFTHPLRVFAQSTIILVFAGAAAFAEPAIETPEFKPPAQSYTAPIQTGTGRCALVTHSGLYQLPEANATLWCLGRPLPVLDKNLVFVRATDDFYTGKTAVWSGKLTIQGEPGMLQPPAPQGYVDPSGAFTGIFHTEKNEAFQHNGMKPCAPNWYFPKPFDIIGTRKDKDGESHPNPVTVTVEVPSPKTTGNALLRVALNSNAAKGKENTLSITLNGTSLVEKFSWKEPGYRIISLEFDAALLKDGKNEVELLGDATYVKYLDYVEIEAAAAPTLRDSALIVLARADTTLDLPGATHAADITDFGAEKALPAGKSVGLKTNRLYCFAKTPEKITFGEETTLAEPALEGKNYLCIGMRDMLPGLDALLQQKTADGLYPASVPFEDVCNVYNGGMYGPSGIVALLERFKPEYLLIAGGFHRDCRAQQPDHAADPAWQPGIPAGLIHLEQLTVNDDLYSLKNTVNVSRVPLRAKEEFAAWAAKAVRYTPPDNLILFAGENKKVDFSNYQRQYIGNLPSATLEADGVAQETVRKQLFGLMNTGATLVLYQGHAQSWELDKGLLKGQNAKDMPESCWVLATCNAAYYHGDFEVYVRDWMAAPAGGCVNALASSSVGADDQQDMVIRRFIEHLKKNPDENWGGMMRFLKRNLPLAENVMNDPKAPKFITANLDKDRMTIDAYSCLGDPAARIFAKTPRKAAFTLETGDDKRQIYAPGPGKVTLNFTGPWDAALPSLGLQWSPANKREWNDFPLEQPLQTGNNTFTFDSATVGKDGGTFELAAIERRTDLAGTIWTTTRLTQESVALFAPVLMIQKRPEKDKPEQEKLVCFARPMKNGPRRDRLQTQFQVRDAAAPDKTIEDTGWQEMPTLVRDPAAVPPTYEVRARFKSALAESPWSEWVPFVPMSKEQLQQQQQRQP